MSLVLWCLQFLLVSAQAVHKEVLHSQYSLFFWSYLLKHHWYIICSKKSKWMKGYAIGTQYVYYVHYRCQYALFFNFNVTLKKINTNLIRFYVYIMYTENCVWKFILTPCQLFQKLSFSTKKLVKRNLFSLIFLTKKSFLYLLKF